jgi:hypothetical protein
LSDNVLDNVLVITVIPVSTIMCIIVAVALTTGALGSTTVHGTITNMNSYNGAGQISAQGLGGSEGSTSALTYYNVTITYSGMSYHYTATCNIYHIGGQFPLQKTGFGQVSASRNVLPTGC